MSAFNVENQWGGSSAPWRKGGLWILGSRKDQYVEAMDIASSDGGKTFTGTMTYQNEGPIGFKATLDSENIYHVENQWGGSSAPWHDGGHFIIGGRQGQQAVALKFTASDQGKSLSGTMTYAGEGPIGFRAQETSGFEAHHVDDAFDHFAQWFPDEQQELDKNQKAITQEVITTSSKDTQQNITLGTIDGVTITITPCEEAIAVVLVDAVFFILGMVGLHVSNQERMTRAIIRELGPETLRGFERAIHNFNTAEGAYQKAKALFAILGGIWKAGGFKAVFKELKDEMSWWEWVKTGILAVAQIVAWFATDGIAFIAEAALTIMSAEQLIEDSVKAVKTCS
ncbi:MAG: hypothetical protein AAFQ98_16745 [Bacteroidota bacterium]